MVRGRGTAAGGVLLAVGLVLACSGPGETIRADRKVPAGALEPVLASPARSPLGLDLDGAVQSNGDLVLVATIQVAARLAAPPVLRIGLPEGASLVRGFAEEVLAAPGRDVTYRRQFTVRPALGPVRVVVQSIGIGHGVRVEGRWPVAEAE